MDVIITICFIVFCGVFLISWDIYVAFFNDIPNRKDTISGIFLSTSSRFAAIPYAAGVLGGHLFWPRASDFAPSVFSIGALLAIGLFLTGLHYLALQNKLIKNAIPPIIYALVGIPLGSFFWPQVF